MQKSKRRHRAIEFGGEEVGIKPKVAGERAMQPSAEPRAGIVVGEQRLSETRQARPGVERTERLASEEVGIVRRYIEADVEGFLHIGSTSGIERFVQHSGIAPVAPDPFDRQSLLTGEGQPEEATGLLERAAIRSGSTPWLAT